MRKYLTVVIIGVIVLNWGCSNVNQNAADFLHAARIELDKGNFDDARQKIDTMRMLYPTAYKQIRLSELLCDSITKAANSMQIDTIREQLRTVRYDIRMSDSKSDNLKVLHERFDSLAYRYDSCTHILSELRYKELKLAARTQCCTAMRNRR